MSEHSATKIAAPQKTSTATTSSRPMSKPSITPARTALLQRACACGELPGSGGKCDDCDKKNKKNVLQRASSGGPQPASIPPVVNQVLSSPGHPLDTSTRTFMESRFGQDFSRVRIHNDANASASARAVNAKAYTVGQDIVFDSGHYNPTTESGRRLMAHELAHTIQQGGIHRYADNVRMGEGPQSHLEREADAAADRAMSASHTAPAMPVISSRAGAVISRQATSAPPPASDKAPPAPEEEAVRGWEDVPVSSPLAKIAKQQSKLVPGEISPNIRAYRMSTPFPLPPEKGPVIEMWEQRAKAGALESFIGLDGNPRSVLKQERPSTDELRKIWLAKVNWNKADAAKNWASVGGDTLPSFEPMAGGRTCEMDHVIELQIGGNNIVENIQPLDRDENGKSGREIFAYLKEQAQAIRAITKVNNIILHFDAVAPSGTKCNICCQIEQKATGKAGTTPGVTVAADEHEPYEIKAGVSTELGLPKGTLAKRKKSLNIPLSDSEHTKNKAASTLIPGMVLESLTLPPAGTDVVKAYVDTQNQKTRLPITIEKQKGMIDLNVTPTRELKLSDKSKVKKIAFTYPYLSKGTITKLDYDPAVGLSGAGELTPSLPLLNKMKLKVEFSPTDFRITAGIDPNKINPPFPGAKITKAELALILAPEFEPSGVVEFQYAPSANKLLDGSLKIERDPQGLAAKGQINAYLPGVDKAQGEVKYSGGKWSGGIIIESTQLKNKFPYVQSGTVTVAFSEKGVDPYGKVVIEIPVAGQPQQIEVELARSGAKWVFKGKGILKIPRLDDVMVWVVYDGEHISGGGKTAFTFKGLKGNIEISYYDGAVSGKGELDVNKGKAKGKLVVKLSRAQKFSGEGSITYQVNENLIATAGIILDENEKVTLKGALEFPKPIKLFEGAKGDKEIFKTGITIPIPGASIGPIGLVIKIDGSLGARYGIGPGTLENAKIEAAFNPLEDDPDPVLDMGATLVIPAYAGIYGKVRGSIAIDVAIASVSGGLTVTASADLEGGLKAAVKIHYEKSRFTLDAFAAIEAALVLGLKLDADVMAEAGIGPFSVSTKKVWNLASFRFPTGLKFGMKAPFHYASNEPFKVPSMDQIEWITPQLSVGEMLEKIMENASSKEEEVG
jgi:hypothetical protein